MSDECGSCSEGLPRDCPESQRPCGHHCNCSWTQDVCCWCGEEFGEAEPPRVLDLVADKVLGYRPKEAQKKLRKKARKTKKRGKS